MVCGNLVFVMTKLGRTFYLLFLLQRKWKFKIKYCTSYFPKCTLPQVETHFLALVTQKVFWLQNCVKINIFRISSYFLNQSHLKISFLNQYSFIVSQKMLSGLLKGLAVTSSFFFIFIFLFILKLSFIWALPSASTSCRMNLVRVNGIVWYRWISRASQIII